MKEPNDKYRALLELLSQMGPCAVMFSGGVDSAFLLAAAVEALGTGAVAVTGRSPVHPASEHREAVALAVALGARQIVVDTREMDNEEFVANPPQRCGVCKAGIVEEVWSVAKQEGLGAVLDGSNADDLGDFRPGMEAAHRLGVRSPLQELGFTKEEIRSLSREMGLPTWDKPSFACLASRIPYGERITEERLNRVERSEASLREMGLAQLRVRDHGDVARVELAPDDIERMAAPGRRARIVEALKQAGYRYVSLDLVGYRTGSLNEVLGGEEEG